MNIIERKNGTVLKVGAVSFNIAAFKTKTDFEKTLKSSEVKLKTDLNTVWAKIEAYKAEKAVKTDKPVKTEKK